MSDMNKKQKKAYAAAVKKRIEKNVASLKELSTEIQSHPRNLVGPIEENKPSVIEAFRISVNNRFDEMEFTMFDEDLLTREEQIIANLIVDEKLNPHNIICFQSPKLLDPVMKELRGIFNQKENLAVEDGVDWGKDKDTEDHSDDKS